MTLPLPTGTVVVNSGDWSDGFDLANVEITLEPVGPIVDGTTGETITRNLEFCAGDCPAVKRVPLGRYRISARLPRDGQSPEPLRLRFHQAADSPYQSVIEANFEQEVGEAYIRLVVMR